MRKFIQVIKWIGGIGLIVAIVCGGSSVFVIPKLVEFYKQQQKMNASPLVETQVAEVGELVRTISAPGSVRPNREVQLSARVAAKIEELPYEEGEYVEAGALVVRLDASDLRAALEGALARKLADEAGLKAAEATLVSETRSLEGQRSALKNAILDWERNQGLFETGDVSQAVLDDARTAMEQAQAAYDARQESLESLRANVEAARARVAVAEADVEQARENLRYTEITTPIAGYITALNAEEGELVVTGTMNNAGTVILTIADLSEMIVEARLSEVDVTRVKPGQTVEVHINGYDNEFAGTLKRVGLQSKPSSDGTTYFDADVVLHLDGTRMFAGLTANVDIVVETLEEIKLPSQAVLDKRVDDLPKDVRKDNPLIDPDESFVQVVFILEEGKAKIRPVEVSGTTVTDTAVTQGIELGEVVITGPFVTLQDLAHNDPVRIEADEAEEETDADDTVLAEESDVDEADDSDPNDAETVSDADGTEAST